MLTQFRNFAEELERSQKSEARSQNLSRSISFIAERQKSESSSTSFWLLTSGFWLLFSVA
jgi:hypothetical protein